jgi:hypothetical protein
MCPAWESSHYGVVSLLDLLKFNAHDFVMIARKISWIETMAERARLDHPHKMNSPFPLDEFEDPTLSGLPEMRDVFHALSLDSAEDQMNRLIKLFSSKPTGEQLASGLTELQNRLDDQLARRSFYQLRPEVAVFFEDKNPFGDAVATSFPSAAHDIDGACKCYACDRFDAPVYHLMRAMESPLRCLAKNLHVKYSPGWSPYLMKIDKRLRNTKTRMPKKRRQFLSNASTLLFAIKDAWRNETMHLEASYGPDQTARIFESTRAFMVLLASQLHERA